MKTEYLLGSFLVEAGYDESEGVTVSRFIRLVSLHCRCVVRLCCFAVLVTTILTAVLLSAVFAGTALAEPEYLLLRGSDRYETAVIVSQAACSPGVGAVVVATGEDFPDALSAAPLAAAYGGPVLLTHSATLDEATRTEIARLAPGRIYLVGLDPILVSQVKAAFPDLAAADGGVVVLTGADRYETAAQVATEVQTKLSKVTGVVVARGDSFADALSAAPLAAAKGWPILLVPASGPLPEATSETLDALAPQTVLVVGTRVQLEAEGAEVVYLAGVDRYDTCAKVVDYAVSLGLSYAEIGMATGEKFPDALAAGPYLARNGGVLLLTKAGGLPSPISQVLLAHADELHSLTFLGLETGVISQVKLLLFSGDGLPDGFAFSRLSVGSQGAEVLWLEQRLADLTYRPGPIDGVFDKKTYQAVMAFQKWERLSRDGVVGTQVWQRLLTASPPHSAKSGVGTWIEVDKSRQVLLYVVEGTVVRTLAVSTGSAAVGIVTPSAVFTVYAKSGKWDGPRYKPLYLRGILAIHGYPSVPSYPASHGCIRVPVWDQDELFPMVAVGTKVYVY